MPPCIIPSPPPSSPSSRLSVHCFSSPSALPFYPLHTPYLSHSSCQRLNLLHHSVPLGPPVGLLITRWFLGANKRYLCLCLFLFLSLPGCLSQSPSATANTISAVSMAAQGTIRLLQQRRTGKEEASGHVSPLNSPPLRLLQRPANALEGLTKRQLSLSSLYCSDQRSGRANRPQLIALIRLA